MNEKEAVALRAALNVLQGLLPTGAPSSLGADEPVHQFVRQRLVTDPLYSVNYGLAGDFFKALRRKRRTPEQEAAFRLLFSVEYDPVRDLRGSPYPKVIADAVNRNDHRFFITLGILLATKAKGWESLRRPQPPAIAVFLATHWAVGKDGLPPLYSLSQDSLLRVSQVMLRKNNLQWEAIAKWRQRLKLKPFKRQKVEATRTKRGWTFQQADKKT